MNYSEKKPKKLQLMLYRNFDYQIFSLSLRTSSSYTLICDIYKRLLLNLLRNIKFKKTACAFSALFHILNVYNCERKEKNVIPGCNRHSYVG